MGVLAAGDEYQRLSSAEEGLVVIPDAAEAKLEERGQRWRRCWWWARIGVLVLFAAAVVVAVGIFLGPIVIKKIIAPVIEWVATSFTRPTLAIVLFGTMAIFPSLLIPSSPSMWLAGMFFGYGYGFLLITGAISVGMSLPFLIGSLLQGKIHKWLEKWPKQAAFVRLAGEGDWLHQFRAVVLIRISPFPYVAFNYASVATNVKYGPYIAGSMVGTIHETFIAIYTGNLLKSLAEATSQGYFLSADQIICNAIGITVAAVSTAAITIYAKKALQTLQAEEESSS